MDQFKGTTHIKNVLTSDFVDMFTVPLNEPPTLLLATKETVLSRLTLDGHALPGNTSLSDQHLLALDFDHRNGSVCFIHWVSNQALLRCADAGNFSKSWDLPPPSMFSLECKYLITCV
jgi:hypothetical protein